MTSTTGRPGGCSLWGMTGCGCGFLAMLGIALVFAGLLWQRAQERRDPHWNRADYAVCLSQLQYLGRAIDSYQRDNHHLPKTLNDLRPNYLDSDAPLHCPLDTRGLGHPYAYTPDVQNPDDAMITCRNHGQGVLILQRNGKIRVPK